jgi:hypothetical protein
LTDRASPGVVGHVEPTVAQPAKVKTIRPALFWSSIGAIGVVFAAYGYTAWIVSGDATPVEPGPDPIPTGTRLAIAAFQIACPILAVAAIGYVV